MFSRPHTLLSVILLCSFSLHGMEEGCFNEGKQEEARERLHKKFAEEDQLGLQYPEELDGQWCRECIEDSPEEFKSTVEFLDHNFQSKYRNIGSILLYGPPGTGKTELSHALAYHMKRPFLHIEVADISNEYQNSGAQNLKKKLDHLFELDFKSIVIFDEIDAIANSKSNHLDDIKTTKTLDIYIQKCINGKNILPIAITNYPEKLPASTKSRFDRQIKIPYPSPDKIVFKTKAFLLDENEFSFASDFSDDFWNQLKPKLNHFSFRDALKLATKTIENPLKQKTRIITKKDITDAIDWVKTKQAQDDPKSEAREMHEESLNAQKKSQENAQWNFYAGLAVQTVCALLQVFASNNRRDDRYLFEGDSSALRIVRKEPTAPSMAPRPSSSTSAMPRPSTGSFLSATIRHTSGRPTMAILKKTMQ